jgi:hypothetical protein
MKLPLILIVGAMVFLSACSMPPKENDQQAFEADLSEASLFLKTLHTLDTGDVAKTRQIAMIPVFVDISSLPAYAAKSHPTPEQRQELVALARDTLDYLLAHRQEFDTQLPSVQMCVRGLRKILTEPEDAPRLQELSEYLAGREKTMSPDTQKP